MMTESDLLAILSEHTAKMCRAAECQDWSTVQSMTRARHELIAQIPVLTASERDTSLVQELRALDARLLDSVKREREDLRQQHHKQRQIGRGLRHYAASANNTVKHR